ncbi:transposase family protein [Chlorogloeopsis sp. ULAP01]|nr:transposase family protein [Chlorogloeopsis sp. ULAP01]MDM9383476.1 transposase family protein [Chlorogloeopsis sp. ULAP01]
MQKRYHRLLFFSDRQTFRSTDFRLLKITKVRFPVSQLCLADKGYQGIAKIHSHSCIPTKKPRRADLSTPERQHNRNLAQLRVVGEHINRRLKIFRILKEQYRKRRKRFGLRCNLIAGLLNYELALFS